MAYTREQLVGMGLSEVQINAILAVEEDEKKESTSEKVKSFPVKSSEPLKVTTISDLSEYAKGTVVELPSFDGIHPFVAKLKRPSLLVMVKTGKIPNSLINQATQLFQRGAGSLGKDNTIGDMYDIIESICEAALVEPSYSEIKEAGITLTDEQMMAIFSYTQQGVNALEKFRSK